MPDANELMKNAAKDDRTAGGTEMPADQPSVARAYAMYLGSKDNFEVDRQYVAAGLQMFPTAADIARENRRFLYRAVGYLARDEGIDQFVDLGSGLPTLNNVHEVAQAFQPDARVVYVDNDPVVAAHGRALLSRDPNTTFIQADLTDHETIRGAPETRKLLDFSRPTAVLMFSIGHWLPDDETAKRTVRSHMVDLPTGSFLAFSHLVRDDEEGRAKANRFSSENGLPLKVRATVEVDAIVEVFEPVEPGLVDINEWRPDPYQPELPEPHPIVQPYLGASADSKHGCEYGGVLRKP